VRRLGRRGHLGWLVFAALLAALLLGALTFDRRSWPGFLGDEATYLMLAESLAWDGDLRYGRADYDRFVAHWGQPPEGLILQSADGGRTLHYGKPVLYPLAIAPFVRLAPARGAAIANALYLALAGLAAALALRRVAGDAAPWLAAAFLFASVAFAHVFWAHADLFLMCLVAAALALVHAAPEDGGAAERRGWLRWSAAGVLLALVLAARPFYGTLFLPAALAAPAGRRRRGVAALVAGAALTLFVQLGGAWVARGTFTSYGAERLSFESSTGFPEADPGAPGWSERIAARGGSGSWLAPGRIFPYPVRARVWAYDTLYLLAGRHVGLLPYSLPALFALLLAGRGRGRWALLAAVAATAALFFLVRPYNFYGGGGALANRYLLPVYPAFWFVVARAPRRVWGPAWVLAAAIGAAPFLWPLWTAPRGYPLTAEGGYRHVSAAARRLLPYETTQSHLKPSGGEDFVHAGLWIKPLGTETRAVGAGQEIACCDRPGALLGGELLLGSPRPLAGLRLTTAAGGPLAVARAGGIDGVVAPRPGVLELRLGRPYARHPMWWTDDDVYLYRLVLGDPDRRGSTFALSSTAK
jgi:hypothetical protein